MGVDTQMYTEYAKTSGLFSPSACCLSCVTSYTFVFRLTIDTNTTPLPDNPITDMIPGKAGETLYIMATMQEHLLLVLGTCSRSLFIVCNITPSPPSSPMSMYKQH